MSKKEELLSFIQARTPNELNKAPIVALDQWAHFGAGLFWNRESEDISLFTDIGGRGWEEFAGAGSIRDPLWYEKMLSESWSRGALAGMTITGAEVEDSDDHTVLVMGISGLAAPDVQAVRIESTAVVRTVLLRDMQVSAMRGVFAAVGVAPFTVTPIWSNGNIAPGRLDVPAGPPQSRRLGR